MIISPENILAVLEHYKYWLVFPIAVFEGPIISVISGFLIYLGTFNFYIIYPLLILADLVGDTLYYLIGRYGGRSSIFKKIGSNLGYSDENEKYIEEHFIKHPAKTLLTAKFTHGLGGTVQATAGIARMNYFEFIKWNLVGQLPKSLILIIIGYYVGDSYQRINSYLEYIAFFTFSLFIGVIMYFVISKRLRKSLTENN
ncbi:MAG: DedA family protein [Candidatus Zambryskibacteria bacterium]|nr:DedA family protein [Candidatus Zambryskibacteria bacterium]